MTMPFPASLTVCCAPCLGHVEFWFSVRGDAAGSPNDMADKTPRVFSPTFADLTRPTEVDRAHENLQKSGKGYGMGGRRKFPFLLSRRSICGSTSTYLPHTLPPAGRPAHNPGPRSRSVNSFDDARGPPGPPGANLQNFYATQRHQPSRGSNDAEQVMQAKRRMAAQRERELRNLHTEQQYQRSRPPSVV